MKFVKRIRNQRVDIEIAKYAKGPNTAVLLEVSNGTHWLVAIRKSFWTNDWVCVDPWTGKQCLAVAKYHNITGSAHFQGI